MVFGRMDPAFGLVAAEADREFHQLGRSGRRAPGRRFIGRGVQSVQCFRVRAGAAASAICLALSSGIVTVCASDRCMARRSAATRVGVDAVGQQGVGESHEIAVNPDDALGFCLTKQLDAKRR